MINPINHTRTPEGVERYRTEPYAIAADVYAHPMHVGRGGWTWYTGSAGWMYRAAVEAFLGMRVSGATFSVDPRIPSAWPGYSLIWRRGGTTYRVIVTNPQRGSRGIASAELDGLRVDPTAMPLVDDDRTHEVAIVVAPPNLPSLSSRAGSATKQAVS